jgi:hypothetical protein
VTVWCAVGYMLENPVYPALLAPSGAVTMRQVRKTSRKGSIGSMPIENPQRPYAGPLPQTRKRMRWSDPCGDVGRLAETTSPPLGSRALSGLQVTAEERNSLSGKSHLPRAEVTLHVNPAHNGEPQTGSRRRGMPWEALCLLGGMAP